MTQDKIEYLERAVKNYKALYEQGEAIIERLKKQNEGLREAILLLHKKYEHLISLNP